MDAADSDTHSDDDSLSELDELDELDERAAEASGLAGAATRVVERLLDFGIDGHGPVDSAQLVADKARAAHPDADQAIDAVVRNHHRVAAAGGFVTGLGGFVTLPVRRCGWSPDAS